MVKGPTAILSERRARKRADDARAIREMAQRLLARGTMIDELARATLFRADCRLPCAACPELSAEGRAEEYR